MQKIVLAFLLPCDLLFLDARNLAAWAVRMTTPDAQVRRENAKRCELRVSPFSTYIRNSEDQHLRYTSSVSHQPILLGTSSFSANGWAGSFYPKGLRSSEHLAFYAQNFHTVEVDSTFYACPSAQTVSNWAARTPEDFIFSVKVPQVITHEKVLTGCEPELTEFLETMDILGSKLGPIVFQFPFFGRSAFRDQHEFLDRLIPFLSKLPESRKFAIEIRNRAWLNPELASLLRDFKVALVLQDRSWMPSPSDLDLDPITTDWTYIRWLGDRKSIEEQTMAWDKTVVDRTSELTTWVDYCYKIQKRGVMVYAYANNHYAGHAPATIKLFHHLWNSKGLPGIDRPVRIQRELSLFPE